MLEKTNYMEVYRQGQQRSAEDSKDLQYINFIISSSSSRRRRQQPYVVRGSRRVVGSAAEVCGAPALLMVWFLFAFSVSWFPGVVV